MKLQTKSNFSNKAQVSMELVLIFGFIIIVFITFMGLISAQFSNISEEKDYAQMRILAENIRNEVIIASQVHNNYLRKFEIPSTINQNKYDIFLDGDILTINTSNNKNYLIVLPLKVKGSFTDDIKIGNLDHCITKTITDNIRISKNQASIEINLTDDDKNGIPDVKKNEHFHAYLRINCVEDIRGIAVILRYNNTLLDYWKFEIVYEKEFDGAFSNHTGENPFISFDPEFGGKISEVANNLDPPMDDRIMLKYRFSADTPDSGSGNADTPDSGSGNLFKFFFKVRDDFVFDPDNNIGIIQFDPRSLKPNLKIVKGTGTLPPTLIDAKFEIKQ